MKYWARGTSTGGVGSVGPHARKSMGLASGVTSTQMSAALLNAQVPEVLLTLNTQALLKRSLARDGGRSIEPTGPGMWAR